ncbi:MAG: flagellar biosynthesis protein FliQ [Lachnospiraceae bacterium]|nr:flagellar biosynthesis protein FliQ [Lachnospiraceae bacterium]
MTVEAVLDVAIETIWTIIITSAPLLIVSLIVGLVISIFQAVTSIQEQTLTFVPKILAIFICILIFGSFILNTIVDFMTELWNSFGDYL